MKHIYRILIKNETIYQKKKQKTVFKLIAKKKKAFSYRKNVFYIYQCTL